MKITLNKVIGSNKMKQKLSGHVYLSGHGYFYDVVNRLHVFKDCIDVIFTNGITTLKLCKIYRYIKCYKI